MLAAQPLFYEVEAIGSGSVADPEARGGAMADEIFQVEKIISKRRHNGVDQYYIKWQGYSKAHNTWEPKANILDPHLVSLFEAEWAAKQAPSGLSVGSDAKSTGVKRAKTAKTPPTAPKPEPTASAATGRAAQTPVEDEDSAPRIELRQHQDELCTLKLSAVLQPSSSSKHALEPDAIFASVRDACADGILVVKDRARLVDVQDYLSDDRVRPHVYVWAAEPVDEDEASLNQAHDRTDSWANDLVKRERAAVVQLPRRAPLGSDLFILPPNCAAWEGLVGMGAELDENARLALVLVCAADEDATAA